LLGRELESGLLNVKVGDECFEMVGVHDLTKTGAMEQVAVELAVQGG
jgi:hypothetical protein